MLIVTSPRLSDWTGVPDLAVLHTKLKLCFVHDCWAYFSTADPTDVWGDDWNDAPHDCNAGTPYKDRAPDLVQVAFDGDLEIIGSIDYPGTPAGSFGYLSAQQINGGAAPWLAQVNYGRDQDDRPFKQEIYAGTTLTQFRRRVSRAGGHVYTAMPGLV